MVDPVIFIGGGNDALTGASRKAMDLFHRAYPNVPTKYFSHDQKNDVEGYINSLGKNVPLSLIGQSWGGGTAGEVVLDLPGRIDTLITLDAVGGIFGMDQMERISQSVRLWIDVATFPKNWEFADYVAAAGGNWGSAPSGFASAYIPVDMHHGWAEGLLQKVLVSPVKLPW